jgi:hypothetical protein
MLRRIALCLFALGTVAGLAVAALCVPLACRGDWEPFGVSVGTAALFVVSLVINLDKVGEPKQPLQPTAST